MVTTRMGTPVHRLRWTKGGGGREGREGEGGRRRESLGGRSLFDDAELQKTSPRRE